ncbi:MAG: hypothetical protein IIB43_01640 [Candidatus Marinimicrobia bacterium]|nr:hypothetical protein [Candidatus Neomarinimicrobiota bacterium]
MSYIPDTYNEENMADPFAQLTAFMQELRRRRVFRKAALDVRNRSALCLARTNIRMLVTSGSAILTHDIRASQAGAAW